jgi:hypothetical protein
VHQSPLAAIWALAVKIPHINANSGDFDALTETVQAKYVLLSDFGGLFRLSTGNGVIQVFH